MTETSSRPYHRRPLEKPIEERIVLPKELRSRGRRRRRNDIPLAVSIPDDKLSQGSCDMTTRSAETSKSYDTSKRSWKSSMSESRTTNSGRASAPGRLCRSSSGRSMTSRHVEFRSPIALLEESKIALSKLENKEEQPERKRETKKIPSPEDDLSWESLAKLIMPTPIHSPACSQSSTSSNEAA